VSREGIRIRTAYHEAGHAVAAVVFGIGVTLVTIVPDHASERSTGRAYARDLKRA